jgi:DNA repair exonuclease SbcCD ATPase subunit
MITHIFHISDIHIFDRNYVNIRSSWNKLINIIINKPNYKNTSLLVITGDIFEFKTYLNSDDVHLFYELVSQLEQNEIKTIIIPGNHDYNINTRCAQDNISILLGQSNENIPFWKFIKCYSKSGIYLIDNINFYVFSPIDKIIPKLQNTNSDKINIALLHESVISAKYENNENIFSGRFTQEQLSHFDIVMLGDIHRPQFLTPTMAYAGSFVQKNRGEGLNHGYILWDIINKTGKHFWIPLEEVALKIVARDNEFMAPLPDINSKITYLGLIHQNCSMDWLQTASGIIRDKYKQPITQILRNDISTKEKISIKNSLTLDMSKFSHTNLIVQLLQKSNTDNSMIQRILDYHNKFLQNRLLFPTIRYHIKYLSWSNVFCYGDNNYINFDDLTGLVALSGKNKAGKSSVIDIIIRILFNECERGHKDDVLNKHTRTGYIKCCFQIENDEYIIEQIWHKYSASTTFHLYKNGEDITKDSLIKTYKFIREDLGLGNYKDFVNLTTAMQNRKFIIDLDKKDIYSLLCKLLDIDTMRDIEEQVKKERDLLKRDKKSKLKEITNENNYEEYWNNELSIINKNKENELIKKSELEVQLKKNIEDICEFNRKVQYVNLPENWEPYEIENIELPFSTEEYNQLIKQQQDLKIKFNIIKENLSSFNKSRIKEIKNNSDWTNLYEYFGITDNVIFSQELLNKLKNSNKSKIWNISNFKTTYTFDELINWKVYNENIDELYRQLIPCSQQYIIDIVEPKYDSLINLEEQLNKFNEAEQNIYIYKNKKNIVNEIFEGIKTLDEKSTQIINYVEDIYNKCKDEYISAKNIIKLNKDVLLSKINEWKKYYEIINNNNILKQNELIEEKIKQYHLYQDVKHDIIQHQHTNENNEIYYLQNILNQYNNYIYLEEYSKIRENAVDIKTKYEEITLKINQYDEASRKIKDIENYDENLIKYRQLLDNIKYDANIEELKKNEQDIINSIKDIDNNLFVYNKNIDNIENILKKYKEIERQVAEIDDALNLYETYYSCINHKTGIPSIILKEVCILLTERCNEILDNITDFNVEFIFDDEIRINTINKNNNIKLSASLGSGFQKFLLDMIMRIVLTRISNISNPNILFIDEGFGCLDKQNFINVCSCLTKMKDNFDAMIIITHIPELQAYMNQILQINTDNNASKLQFGNLTLDQYDIFENINLRAIRDTLNKNPEVPIEENDTKKLCKIYNTTEEDLPNKILQNLMPLIDDKYVCTPCNKTFKKIEQAKTHINSKTYKNKHYKFLIQN